VGTPGLDLSRHGAPAPKGGRLTRRRNSVIESLGVYLPSKCVSTREILADCRNVAWLSPERVTRIEQLTGITSRRVAGEDEAAIDLARNAMSRCLAASAHAPSEIDILISCAISRYERPNRYRLEPGVAAVLAGEFGLDRALALDISNGCAGMFTAVKLVDSLIRAGLIAVGMIVSGEHITDLIRTAQREVTGRLLSDPRFACLTLGDAAAALILEEAAEDRVGFHAIDLYTAAIHNGYSIGRPTDREHGGAVMFTDSAKLFDTAIRHSASHVVRLLGDLGWSDYRPDHIIIHQSGQTAVHEAAWRLNERAQAKMCDDENMINNVADRGNTASTTHFVAIWDNVLSGRIKAGDDVLFAIQGSGLTIGTAPYTLDDLPDRIRLAQARAGLARAPAPTPRATRAVLEGGFPRVRIESVGVADALTGPGAGMRLVEAAIDRCLADSRYAKSDVELLIYVGGQRDDLGAEPATAALIAGRLGLHEAGPSQDGRKVLAFDLCNGALGFLQACRVGAGLIQSGEFRTVMVAASEVEHNAGVPGAPRRGVAEVGSAVILDSSPDGGGFGASVFTSVAEHARAFSVSAVNADGRPRLHVERASDLETSYLRMVPPAVGALLSATSLRVEDIAVVLPPQTSATFAPRLAQALHAPRDRIVDIGEDGKDLASSALAYSLWTLRRRQAVRSGDVGLIINVGSGLQVGAALYHF